MRASAVVLLHIRLHLIGFLDDLKGERIIRILEMSEEAFG
jgi:hypothetical protein